MARTRPSAPHNRIDTPNHWKSDCFQMAASPKKCAPTTNEIHAAAARGVCRGPFSSANPTAMGGYNLDGHDEPVTLTEATTLQRRDSPRRGTTAT